MTELGYITCTDKGDETWIKVIFETAASTFSLSLETRLSDSSCTHTLASWAIFIKRERLFPFFQSRHIIQSSDSPTPEESCPRVPFSRNISKLITARLWLQYCFGHRGSNRINITQTHSIIWKWIQWLMTQIQSPCPVWPPTPPWPHQTPIFTSVKIRVKMTHTPTRTHKHTKLI